MKERREGMWPWLMQRITAIYLVFGLGLHFLLTHVFLKRPITLNQVEGRLLSKWWIWFDITLLAAAVYHAALGIVSIYTDYNPHPGNKKLVNWMTLMVAIATFLAGLYILVPLAGRGF